MGRRVRVFLVVFAALAIPLGLLAAVGATVALRQLGRDRDAAVAQTLGVLTAVLAEAQETLRREALVLARDPALVESATKGDWATLARWGSPRILAVTRDGAADLVVVRDARGVPLVQVPAAPRPALPELVAPAEPQVVLRLVDGRPHFLAMTSLSHPWAADTAADQPRGAVVIGRRVESVSRVLDRAAPRAGVVFVAGDLALAAPHREAPAGGWNGAISAGRAVIGAEVFAVRPLVGVGPASPDGALWGLVAETEFSVAARRLWVWLVSLLAGGVVVLALGVGVILRGRIGRSGPGADTSPPAIASRDATLEALNAIAVTIGRGGDLVATAEEILDVVRGLARIDVGSVYRLDEAAGALVLLAQRGLSPDLIERFREQPVAGSHLGEAVRTGQARVAHLDAAAMFDIGLREAAERRGHRTQLTVPIPVQGRIWGVLALVSQERREFPAEELAALDAVAHQVGMAVQRAQLQETAAVRLGRLEARHEIERHISEQLDLEQLLVIAAGSALRLIGGTFSIVYLRDNDALRPRAWSGIDDWIRDAIIPVGKGVVGTALASGDGVIANDYPASPLALAPFMDVTMRLLAQPLVAGGRGLGVMVISRDAAAAPFTAEDLSALADFATQASVAIDNARLFAETARHLQETRALLEVAEILNSTLDPRRLLKQVAIRIAQLCRVDRCSIERWDGDRVIPLMSQFADGRRDERLWAAFVGMPSYVPRAVPAHAQAIDTRRPVIIADATATDLIPREWVETFGHKAFMAVPLIRQDVVIGLMTLDYTDRVTAFEPWQVSLATAMAGQLALAIENARLYGEARERLSETTTLLAVGQALSQPGPSEEVMRRAAREVARAFGADMVGVYMQDARKEALVPVAGYHVPKHLLDVFLRRSFVLARFSVVREWQEGRAVWSSDLAQDPRFDQAAFEGMGPMSVLFAPTPVRGESVGAIFLVWWMTGREFPPAEVRLIEGVAAQVGLAMENAELARRTQLKLEETESLLGVSRTLSSTLDLDTLPRHFLRHIVRILGADTAGMWLLDEGGEWMQPFVGYHVPLSRLEAIRGLRLSIARHAFYAEAARTRQPVVATDVMRDERIPREVCDVVPQRTQIFVPIIAKDRMLGGFAATWWETARELTESELRLMEAIASQAGVALENARLFRDNQRRVEELSVLHELSRAVTGRLDQAGLLETIHQQLARLLDARHLVILLHGAESDDLEVVLRVREGVRVDGEPRRYPRRAAGLFDVVLDTGRPVRTDDYPGACRCRGVEPARESAGLPHWLGVPMAAGDLVLGVLALRSAERAFSEGDERLLANIADLAALALRSARLYEERTRAHGELGAAQAQLVRTEKLRAMGEMASGVAHDFNNVLASILGRAQLLLGRVEDPTLRQWLGVIERSAMDGARTVRRLQEFTRIRRDHPVVPVDLNEIIQQTLEATESSWRQESRSRGIAIEVETRLTHPLPKISGDPAELREALTNLVLNALDAMPGGGSLRLATSVTEEGVEATVADTGTGIAEDIRERIFDPFFTTKGPKGTGLGLSMTYGILARHSGRIAVESEGGRGTTFRLVFPSTEGAPEPPASMAAPTAVPSPLRCLVVDDEEAVAGVLGDMLMAVGHEAAVVRSGEEAVRRFRAEPFDVVLTDLAMPGMTGWEVAQAIKRTAPDTRVVLVSGFGVELSPQDLRANGVDLVLAKPVNLRDIMSALEGQVSLADERRARERARNP